MKFIHFADAHLDSPFRGLSFLPSEEFNHIYQAADQSLTKIVDLALQENVDLVLIAGDTLIVIRHHHELSYFLPSKLSD